MSGGARSARTTAPALTPVVAAQTEARYLKRALIALCLTELTSWGTLYYSFPAAITEVTRETGWSTTAAMGAYSAGLLAGVAAGLPVGWLLDRHGPRRVMTCGSLLGTCALSAVAAAPSFVWFIVAWVLAGLAQATLLYPPAFAALTRWYGPGRLRPITTVTLVAGLSSTLCAPLTAALVAHLGWRTAYGVLAALLAAITLPLHLFFLTPPWPRPGKPTRTPAGHTVAGVREVASSRAFLLLAAATGLASLGLYAATTNLVPLLVSRGTGATTAATALGLCGAGQLLGRLCYPILTRRAGPSTRTAAILAAGAATVAALAAVPGPVPLLIAIAIFAGAVRGAFTLLQATAVSDRWGSHDVAATNALATAPAALAIALAPATGTLLADQVGGCTAAFWLLAGSILLGAVLAARARVTSPWNATES